MRKISFCLLTAAISPFPATAKINSQPEIQRLKVSDNKWFLAGTYAMVYVPTGCSFKVRMDKIISGGIKAWWFNPRDGKARLIGQFLNTGEREFTSPDRGENLDWILVLDDIGKNYPAPGTVK